MARSQQTGATSPRHARPKVAANLPRLSDASLKVATLPIPSNTGSSPYGGGATTTTTENCICQKWLRPPYAA